MSKRKNRKPIGIPDTWALCGLYALLLALFFIPGIIIEGQPLSAWTLMRATDLRQFGQYPGSIAAAREMAAMPVLCAIGLALTLAFRTSSGKYAFGACISALLFGAIGVFSVRYLPHAGGFVIGMSMFVALALFFVSVICAVVRRSSK